MNSESWQAVAYVDETFNRSHYWIAAVLVPVELVVAFQEALREIIANAAVTDGIPVDAELRGHDLWHGERSFTAVLPRLRVSIYRKAVSVLEGSDAQIVIRGVERERIRSNHPHRIAWRYAIEDVDEIMNDREGSALVVADRQAEIDRHLPADIARYRSRSTGGWKPRKIRHVLQEIKFVDSAANPLIQYADLVAFIHQRRTHVPVETDHRSQREREKIWGIIDSMCFNIHCWRP